MYAIRSYYDINAAHNPPVLINMETAGATVLKQSCVGVGMLDEMPWVRTDQITLTSPTKIICYTDGLSELKDESGNELGTGPLIKHYSNSLSLTENIGTLIEDSYNFV